MEAIEFINSQRAELPEIACIYAFVNLVNGKVYIGQTINLKERYSNHRSAAKQESKANRQICRAMRKYGFNNFKLIVFEIIEDLSKLTEREVFWTKTCDSSNPKKGYNSIVGGITCIGHTVSKETREKLRIIHTERMKDPTKNPMYGRKHSEETKEKIRRTRIERGYDNEIKPTL